MHQELKDRELEGVVNVTAASHLTVGSADMPRFGGPDLKKTQMYKHFNITTVGI